MTVDVSGLLDQIETYALEIGHVCASELEAIVKDAAPVGETGQLRDAITAEVTGAGGGSVSILVDSPAEASSWTDEGTDPHRIEGNPLLAFDWPAGPTGGLWIGHGVNHPGNPAQNWFGDPMPDYFQTALNIAESSVSV